MQPAATTPTLLRARAAWIVAALDGRAARIDDRQLAQAVVEQGGAVASDASVQIVGDEAALAELGDQVEVVLIPLDEVDAAGQAVRIAAALPPGDIEIVGAALAWRRGVERTEVSRSMVLDALLDQLRQALDQERERADRAEEAVRTARAVAADHTRTIRQMALQREAAVKQSSRYLLGDTLMKAVRQPRTIPSLPRSLRDVYRRNREERASLEAGPPPAPPRRMVRIATVLDEFSHDCFAPEAALLPLDIDRWQEQLEETTPSLLFVESAWRGNGGQWRYAINKFATRSPNHLLDLVRTCQAHGIPTVFWNKEDPANFKVFLDAARIFDVVLTTDSAIVADYVREVGHDRVAALPFAAQPRLHNPTGNRREVLPRVCFAGAWRGDKYAKRGSDFRILLDPALEAGVLDIYDRYANTKEAGALGFPEPYRRAVVGSLPYSEMVGAYRRYAAFLNVNSVSESPTMFSRRVFEILACGTPVISTWSRGIEEMLGEHVILTTSEAETRAAVEEMVHDPEARDRRGHLGYRYVHSHHTYEKRLDTVLEIAGIAAPKRPVPLVSVVCVSNRPEQLVHAFESYRRQQGIRGELIYVANSSAIDPAAVDEQVKQTPGARALFIDESATLADCLNEALEIAEGEYFAKFDDDDHYGPNYLADLLLTFDYSGAAVAGKRTHYSYLESRDLTVLRYPGQEFRYVKLVAGGTIVADRRATAGILFTPVQRGTDTLFLEDCRAAGLRIFSADRYNFVQQRHADPRRHTWAIEEKQYLARSEVVGPGLPRSRVFI